jgi:hypothetical protein
MCKISCRVVPDGKDLVVKLETLALFSFTTLLLGIVNGPRASRDPAMVKLLVLEAVTTFLSHKAHPNKRLT